MSFFAYSETPARLDEWDYFWRMLPYAVPGIFTFLAGLALSVMATIAWWRRQRAMVFLAFAIFWVGVAFLGLALATRALVLDRALLLALNNWLYPLVMSFAPGGFLALYHLTGKPPMARLLARLSWLTVLIALPGVFMGEAFRDEWNTFFFGQYPRSGYWLLPWAITGVAGTALYALPKLAIAISRQKDNRPRLLLAGFALQLILITSNFPALAGLPVFPLGLLSFLSLFLMAYGVFRSDFLDLNDLLFRKNGLFYSLNILPGLTISGLGLCVVFGYAPANLAGLDWFPWLLIPFISALAVFALGILVGGTNPSGRLNQLGAFSLYQNGFLMLAVLAHSLGLEPIVARRLEQLFYIPFGLAPAVQVRFALLAMNRPMPRFLPLIDLVSITVSALALSPWLFSGYYKFPWGNIGAGGPLLRLYGLAAFLATGFVTHAWFTAAREARTRLGDLSALSVILGAALIMGNLPATMGYSVYPVGNLVILPTGLFAYAVLRHGGAARETRALRVGHRMSLVILALMPLIVVILFALLPIEYRLADRWMYVALVAAPVALLSYLLSFLLVRPLTTQIDRSYLLLEEEKRSAQAMHREAQLLGDLARGANDAQDLETIMTVVAQVVLSRLRAGKMMVHTVNRNAGRLEMRSLQIEGRSIPPGDWPDACRYLPLAPGGGSLYRTYRRARPFYLPRLNPRWLASSPADLSFADGREWKWLLQIPLIADGQTSGILALTGNIGERHHAADLLFAERVAAQVAGAVRTAELLRESEAARAESDRLLNNILPITVAEELKTTGAVAPKFYEDVTVVFTDFVGFTRASEHMTPGVLVRELDGCFSQFDAVIARYGLEKFKTIGDAYMCAGGVPRRSATHPLDACLAALEFRDFITQMAEVKQAMGFDSWQIRIGIHTGAVTAGVIGTLRFAYDIWGDTVNTASRMESHGVPGAINISALTYARVREYFVCEPRGRLEVKGKGAMDMYILSRLKPEWSADDIGHVPNEAFRALLRERHSAGLAAQSPPNDG